MSEENECKINNWIRNPGYQLIPIFIFECLDLESLATCRKVSTEWRDFVDELTSFWRRHLAKTRVLIEFTDTTKNWSTIGVHENIINASWNALCDGFNYYFMTS